MKIYFWLIIITLLLIWLIAEQASKSGYSNLCKAWCVDEPSKVISGECFCMKDEKTWKRYERSEKR